MAIIIFLIILSILIVVHELGHFAVAKKFGIRVDEFGLGYPPRAKKLFRWKGTDFTLNWLPFGGFVKIFGEDGIVEPEPEKPEKPELVANSPMPDREQATQVLRVPENSFVSKNRGIQAAVLVAGVTMNFLFAWFLISLGFIAGLPSSVNSSFPVENPQTIVTSVLPNSPAEEAGLKAGDVIVSVSRGALVSSSDAKAKSDFIASSNGPVILNIERGKDALEITAVPEFSKSLGKPIIGVSMDEVGIAKLSFPNAIWQGLKITLRLTVLTAEALWNLITQAFQGRASLEGLTGPVGLVGIVGDASVLGFTYLLSLTALISVNLTLINLLPFPALDGGRLLVVLVEAIARRNVPASIINALNTFGFALLIFLMVLISIQDVRNLF
ncbi:MAG: site-2 protease family protein [Patescibacteria group bacterium]